MTVNATIYKINGERIKANASVTLEIDGKYKVVLNDILIKKKRDSDDVYVEFPGRFYVNREGKRVRKNISFPASAETRAVIVDAILAEFNKA